MSVRTSVGERRQGISGLRKVAFALTPTLVLLGVFSLGFLGEPENDPWFNASPLWGPGDPFYSHNRERAHYLSDPLLIWRGRPNFDGVFHHQTLGIVHRYHHNSLGFRDDEVVIPKPEGVVRILNVGDSSTWGLNLYDTSNSYPDQLQRILDRKSERGGTRYDVVNASVAGYSSLQALQQLRYHTPGLEPDIVTVYIGNNDPALGTLSDADRVADTAGPLRSLLQRNRFYLLLERVSYFFQAGLSAANRQALVDRLRTIGTGKSTGGASPPPLLPRVSADEYEANLRGIVEEIHGMGARPLLLASSG